MDEDGYGDEEDGNWKDQEDMHLMNDLGAQMAGVDIDDNDDENDDQGVSMDVVDYDDIEVHLEGDDDLQDGQQQHQQLDQLEDDDDEEDQYKDEDDQDPDNEVSINLEDAIATAEEINSRERNMRNNENDTSSDDD